MNKPRLRAVEAFRTAELQEGSIAVRDPSGISPAMLTVSEPALHLLALMDGTNTCAQMRDRFTETYGQPISIQTIETMLTQLESVKFLEGPAFESHYQNLLDEYRGQPARTMVCASDMEIHDPGDSPFGKMLHAVKPPCLPRPVKGLVAPHLDYPRGEPCYALAYATLRHRQTPERVVILGTNHFGRSPSVVATASAFSTPFGTIKTDVGFLEKLESKIGGLRKYELDHAREHSVELQLGWLQYLFGVESLSIVAFLCCEPCRPAGNGAVVVEGISLRDFAHALGELIANDGGDTLIVAGADLSHVGAAFGPDPALDEAFLADVRRYDLQALEMLESGDPEQFAASIAGRQNYSRVCSVGCLYTIATALNGSTATFLHYHQAVDQATQTCVTCAAMAYT